MVKFHLMLVHFPIALLFVAVIFEVIGHLRAREDVQKAGLYTLLAGFAGAVLAAFTGKVAEESLERFVTRRPGGPALLEAHELAAYATVGIFAAVLLWRTLGRRTLRGPVLVAYLLLAAVGLGSLGVAGFLGGEMAHPQGRGAPPQAAGRVAPGTGGD